jgi:TetR/AcrR family transcriptional regulator, repressor of fatR-cypB operon
MGTIRNYGMNVRSGNPGGDREQSRGNDEPRRGRPFVADKLGRGRPFVVDKPRRGRPVVVKPGRGRPLVDDKRRRILDAALTTFAARGYHGTSVPEVAEAAGVGVGTLYRYFEDKNALVNELYRDAKLRLKSALLDGLAAPDVYQLDNAQQWFAELWQRLAAFARNEPDAFRFLEMQDHVEYLDAESRALELSVLAPLWLAGKRLHDRTGGPPVDIAIVLLWGAFVGLVKASRLGYLPLDDHKLAQAGAAAWRMIAPDGSRAAGRATRVRSRTARITARATTRSSDTRRTRKR